MNEKSRQIALIFVATLLFQEVAKLTGIISAIPSPVLRLVASQFVLAAPAFVYLTVKTVGGRDSFPRVYADTVGMRRTRPASLGLALLLALFMRPLLSLVNYLSSFIATPVITDIMSNVSDEVPYILALPAVALLPAFFEESVYRGVFFKTYREIDPRGALFLSAAMFGLLHGNLNQFIYAFTSGVIFGLVILATDSVLPVMVMHFEINAVSLALLYMQRSDWWKDSFLAGLGEIRDARGVLVLLAVTLVCAAAFAFVYIKMAAGCGRLESVKKALKGERDAKEGPAVGEARLLNAPLVLGMALCLLNIVINELALRGLIT